MVYEVHHNDLTQAQAAKAAVLDFNATWCNPCRMLAPVLEEASKDLAGKALFYGIDVDENPALAARERDALWEVLGPGDWNIFPGHGLNKEIHLT